MVDQEQEWKPGIPRWVQVYEILKGEIERGELAPGDQVPSVLKLQQMYGIATATGQKVHRALRRDGLIRTEPGMGSFVAERPRKAEE
ncbi:GntR family transcriptional regulator [Nonomuraea turcica]|uniref:GntR family transcriptional regulator n=1 Tax=Nonomuraea sp. G32 TaxID=3067274 RepID=UPI00273B5BD3|nr:GntR family transcriptional regulator [Nonomuraea sp. G32]MDP4503794.1 GntR family transcriptional regulator [Nonomuraea sp. G32]